MKQISHYFPFFLLTILLYGLFFYSHKQSIIVPPLSLNSGQQALQLQFIEITQAPHKTAANEPAKIETKAVKEKPKTAKQKTATIDSKSRTEIKIAKQNLQKAIQETSAINDAMLKAELPSADYKPAPVTYDVAEKLPTTKSMPLVNTVEKPDVLQQQGKPKRVFKKQAATSSSSQTQGVLQEAIVVSGNIPIYPKRAILRNQQGRVVVKLTVTTKGTGKNPQIMTSSGHSILDNAVLNFIRKELFMPAHKGEEKITTEQLFAFRFELK